MTKSKSEPTYIFQISTDHGHTWNVSAVMSEVDALKHAFRIVTTAGDRIGTEYADRYVVESTVQKGWRWMWLREENDYL